MMEARFSGANADLMAWLKTAEMVDVIALKLDVDLPCFAQLLD